MGRLRSASGHHYYPYITQMPRTSVKRLLPFLTAPWLSSRSLRLYSFHSMAHGSEHALAALLSPTIVSFGLLRVVVLCSTSHRSEARRLLCCCIFFSSGHCCAVMLHDDILKTIIHYGGATARMWRSGGEMSICCRSPWLCSSLYNRNTEFALSFVTNGVS